ncbi:MAG: helix-turn-helix domain-containing protein [Phycisphaeraceae bacterium]|nr:helix-turn-helix domain-containing protein [Phycisphaeraceae bacterium]
MVSPQDSAHQRALRVLGDAIRARRRSLGLSLSQLASGVGCTKSYLSQIETGYRDSPPSREILASLERALRLAPDSLARHAALLSLPDALRTEVDALRAHRDRAQALATKLKTASLDDLYKSGQLASLVDALAPADADASMRNASPVPLRVQVPLINKVAAGYPTEFTDLGYPARVADEYVAVPEVMDPDAFAARVVGDSMLPDYREGDIVVFSPERTAVDADDCFVRLEPDAETTFKRVYFETLEGEEHIRLQPLNPAYPARTLPRERVAGLYVAVSVIRPVRPR